MVVAATLTFHQQLGVSVVGALATATFGALFVNLLVGRITSKAANVRADREAEATKERADREIRDRLIEELARVAGALYIETQAYVRTNRALPPPAAGEQDHRSPADLDLLIKRKEDLDRVYEQSVVEGGSLERRLEAYFLDDTIWQNWHAVMDCLTVRYFTLILGEDSPGAATIRKVNARDYEGKRHTGLTAGELKEPKQLLDHYRALVAEVTRAVAVSQMRTRQPKSA